MRLKYTEFCGCTGHTVGRDLLAELYREETGEALPPILIGEHGKPYFEGQPYHFSISHTKNHAFCVLADKNVAIDAEELTRKLSPRMADRVLSPGEKAQYDAAEDKQRALLTFWVLKEARAKLSGLGLQGGFRDTDFSLDDSRIREIEGCLVAIFTE